jgi:hypothetical protein
MLSLYYFLARKEEKECSMKFGDKYDEYLSKTNMFIPGDRILTARIYNSSISKWHRRFFSVTASLLLILLLTLIAVKVRDYSITTLLVKYSENSATISTAESNKTEFEHILNIVENDSAVQSMLRRAQINDKTEMINYIAPAEWILPDLPMDESEVSMSGHVQNENFNKNYFKMLFTKAESNNKTVMSGTELLVSTKRRKPVITVYIDLTKGIVTDIKIPPKTVLWGDIPTPIF